MKDERKIDWSAWGDRTEYAGYYGGTAHCLVLVNGSTVICTQPWDNDGLSVTNGAEDIATKVCHARGISMDKLTWIEHYIGYNSKGKLEHRFDLVVFEVISAEPHIGRPDGLPHFRRPKWSYLEPLAAEKLFGCPIPIH